MGSEIVIGASSASTWSRRGRSPSSQNRQTPLCGGRVNRTRSRSLSRTSPRGETASGIGQVAGVGDREFDDVRSEVGGVVGDEPVGARCDRRGGCTSPHQFAETFGVGEGTASKSTEPASAFAAMSSQSFGRSNNALRTAKSFAARNGSCLVAKGRISARSATPSPVPLRGPA